VCVVGVPHDRDKLGSERGVGPVRHRPRVRGVADERVDLPDAQAALVERYILLQCRVSRTPARAKATKARTEQKAPSSGSLQRKLSHL
jgi:hypothetical protein